MRRAYCEVGCFFVLMLIFLGCSAGGDRTDQEHQGISERVFAPYVDVLLYPEFSISAMHDKTQQKYYTLAFIISRDGCNPAWGGVVDLDENHYMSEINAIRSRGGDVIISFGGANGTELAQACDSVASLQAAYQAVIDKYQVKWVDFDIEGAAVSHKPSIDLRSRAIKNLQTANPDLKIAYCLPVLPAGLTQDGLYVIESAKKYGVRVDLVNVMAMDYGDGAAPSPEGKMGQYAIDAGNNTYTQMQNMGINTEIGITPMIGQNDVPTERFYVDDAVKLKNWALSKNWVTLLSMWSANRDNGDCPGGSAQPKCSGIEQSLFAFTHVLKEFTEGGGGNQWPQASITSPKDGEGFKEGSDITIQADAKDPDGTVAKVEFFQGSASLGIDTVTPYSAVWKNVPTGFHSLTVRVTDNDGATTTSASVSVTVGSGSCTTPPWQSDTVYWAGDKVSHQYKEWEAKWWTKNEEPGTTGPDGVWKDLGLCDESPTPSPTPTPQPTPTPTPDPTPEPTPGPTPTPEPAPDPKSCVGYCSKKAPGGCWCDDLCTKYNDCCADKEEICKSPQPTPDPTPTPTPDPTQKSCEGYCDKKSPGGCWCDKLCSSYGDCCPDKQQICG